MAVTVTVPCSVRTTRGWLLATLVFFLAGELYASPFIPLDRNQIPLPECRQLWRAKGFTRTNIDPERRSLFSPARGPEHLRMKTPSYAAFYDRLERSQCYKKITVLVYMAADNDLSRMSWRDLAEMEQVGSTLDVDVLVFQDDAQTDGMRYYHIAKRAPHFHREYKADVENYAITQGREDLELTAQEQLYLDDKGMDLPVSPVVRVLTEGDSGAVTTAGEFLVYGLSRYPSERVALIGWSHGEGFDADPVLDRQPRSAGATTLLHRQGGFAFDYESNSHMKVPDMVRGASGDGGLRAILQKYRNGHTLDWAGSDSCLNQQLEFGLEWQGVVDYLYGSAALVQGKGFNYGVFLRNLNSQQDYPDDEKAELQRMRALAAKNPKVRGEYLALDSRLFAKNIPAIYGRSVGTPTQDLRRSHYDPQATMAVWDMHRLGEVVSSLQDLAKVIRHFVLHPRVLSRRVQRRFELEGVLKNTRRFGGVSNDLYHFLIQLGSWARETKQDVSISAYEREVVQRIEQNIRAVTRALGGEGARTGAVLASYLGSYYQEQGELVPWRSSYGTSVWFPHGWDEFKEMFPKLEAHSVLYQDSRGERSDWAHLIHLFGLSDKGLGEIPTPPLF